MNLIKRLEAIKPKDTDPTPMQGVICDCMDVAIRETNIIKARILYRLAVQIALLENGKISLDEFLNEIMNIPTEELGK